MVMFMTRADFAVSPALAFGFGFGFVFTLLLAANNHRAVRLDRQDGREQQNTCFEVHIRMSDSLLSVLGAEQVLRHGSPPPDHGNDKGKRKVPSSKLSLHNRAAFR